MRQCEGEASVEDDGVVAVMDRIATPGLLVHMYYVCRYSVCMYIVFRSFSVLCMHKGRYIVPKFDMAISKSG